MEYTSTHKRFDHLADEDGWFPPDEGGACPVPDLDVMNSIRINIGRKLPNLLKVPPHDRTMIMVCGGPTAKMYLDEIRERSLDPNCDIFCSNKTHDWLISEGIVPYAHFMIDPKPSKVEDVKTPHPSVKYYIGAQCDPSVFDALEGYDVTRTYCFSNIGGTNNDYKLCALFIPPHEIVPVFGGTMAGLRAMVLGEILGYRTIEFYGFDSCFFDYDGEDPIYYSYEKKRNEHVMEAMTDGGRIFLTTPVFASQARQFIKWKHRLPWVKFIIHGDNLTSALDKEDEERNKRTTDLLISPEYVDLLKQMHQEKENFGNSSLCHELFSDYLKDISFLLSQVHNRRGPLTILDYGSGKGGLKNKLPKLEGMSVREYEPANGDMVAIPSDVVLCIDVLEHVEPQCIDNVLDDLKRVVDHVGYFSIALDSAIKNLPDGRNAHLIVNDEEWWMNKLKPRFKIIETEIKKCNNKRFLIVVVIKGRT